MAEVENVLSIPRALRLFQRKRVPANCLLADLVGDCVYITGPHVGQRFQVARADPAMPSKVPAIGVIISKSAPTVCTVQLFGEVAGIYSGLTPKSLLYVGAGGQPSATPGVLIQALGYAASSDVVFLWPELFVERKTAGLSGTQNGVNLTFGTMEKYVRDSLEVYLNGVRQLEGTLNDFVAVESGGPGTGFNRIVFNAVAPRLDDNLFADYRIAL